MKPEQQLEFSYTVEPADLAKQVNLQVGDQFPAVLSTSRMIDLMELAAARLMLPLLNPGELSVGVNVNVNHLAATPEGETVHIKAIFRRKEWKLFVFDVEVRDRGGKVGSGSHSRAIVVEENVVKSAQERYSKG